MSINKEKEKYLIALDLDGTLLKDDKTLCFLTNMYLRKLMAIDKYYVTFATGRNYKDAKQYADLLKINTPLILNNGAVIFNRTTHDMEYNGMDENLLKECIKDIEPFVLGYTIETFNKLYYTNEKYFGYLFENTKDILLIKGDTPSIITLLNESPVNLVARFKPMYDHDAFVEVVEKYNHSLGFHLRYDAPYFEIYPRTVSKYNSIINVAKKLQIDECNILFFGDQENDLECIKNLPNAYLMKNGSPELKEYAKKVTKFTNNHNGIAYDLHKFFKQRKKLQK